MASVASLSAFVQQLELPDEYVELLEKAGLATLQDLIGIDHDILERAGITKLGHRVRIIKAANAAGFGVPEDAPPERTAPKQVKEAPGSVPKPPEDLPPARPNNNKPGKPAAKPPAKLPAKPPPEAPPRRRKANPSDRLTATSTSSTSSSASKDVGESEDQSSKSSAAPTTLNESDKPGSSSAGGKPAPPVKQPRSPPPRLPRSPPAVAPRSPPPVTPRSPPPVKPRSPTVDAKSPSARKEAPPRPPRSPPATRVKPKPQRRSQADVEAAPEAAANSSHAGENNSSSSTAADAVPAVSSASEEQSSPADTNPFTNSSADGHSDEETADGPPPPPLPAVIHDDSSSGDEGFAPPLPPAARDESDSLNDSVGTACADEDASTPRSMSVSNSQDLPKSEGRLGRSSQATPTPGEVFSDQQASGAARPVSSVTVTSTQSYPDECDTPATDESDLDMSMEANEADEGSASSQSLRGHRRGDSTISEDFLEDFTTVPRPYSISSRSDLAQRPKRPSDAPQTSSTTGSRRNSQVVVDSTSNQSSSAAVRDVQDRGMAGWLKKLRSSRMRSDIRWCVFEDGVFRYYAHEKEPRPHGEIRLNEMVSVKACDKTNSQKYAHKFELRTHDRTFVFFADSIDEMTGWIMLLGAKIQLRPSSSRDLDKHGTLTVVTNNFRAPRVKRFVAIQGHLLTIYESFAEFEKSNHLDMINMQLSSVRGNMTQSGKHPAFKIVTADQRTLTFETETPEEKTEWIEALMRATDRALKALSAPSKKEIKIDEELVQSVEGAEGNDACADCGTADPEWLSINIGVLVCEKCCGSHRQLGVHISKMRSIRLDALSPATNYEIPKRIGNTRANQFWEETLTDASNRGTPEFIRQKYEALAFVNFDAIKMDDIGESLFQTAMRDDLLQLMKLVRAKDVDKSRLYGSRQHTLPYLAREAHLDVIHTFLINNDFAMADEEMAEVEKQNSDSILSQHNAPPQHHEGWLLKRSRKTNEWKAKWCVYSLGSFTYYRSKDTTEPSGKIPIANVVKAAPFKGPPTPNDETGELQYIFTVRTTTGHVFELAATSDLSRRQWLHTFEQSVAALPPGTEGFSFDDCAIQGMLERRTRINAAPRRDWGALRKKHLHFFKSPENPFSGLGEVDLTSVAAIEPGLATLTKAKKGDDDSGLDYSVAESERDFSLILLDRVLYFTAEDNTARDAWIRALRSTRVFGAPLSSSDTVVPRIVEKCCTFIEDFSRLTEGIYRKPGNERRVRAARMQFDMDDKQATLRSSEYTDHDVAGLLKLYFRSLPDPLLTGDLYPYFIKAAGIQDHDHKLYTLKDVVNRLPSSNLETLKRLCIHLSTLASCADSNKMNYDNLAMVFAPTLMHVDRENVKDINIHAMSLEFNVIHSLVYYHEWLFDIEQTQSKDELIEEKEKEIRQLLRKGAADNDAPFIHEIKYKNSHVTIPVSSADKACDVVEKIRTKLQMSEADVEQMALWEEVETDKVVLRRPLQPDESVRAVTRCWRRHHVSCFLFRPDPYKSLIQNCTEEFKMPMAGRLTALKEGGGLLRGGNMLRKSKTFHAICDVSKPSSSYALVCYKDAYTSTEELRVTLTRAVTYEAAFKKGRHDLCFAIRYPTDKDDKIHYFTASDEESYARWMACLVIARSPAKLMGWEEVLASASSHMTTSRSRSAPTMDTHTAVRPVPSKRSEPDFSSAFRNVHGTEPSPQAVVSNDAASPST